MKMSRPDLVVPYRYTSIRDKLYPVVVTSAVVLVTFLIVVLANMKGAR